MSQELRWKQRFENFKRAYRLLSQAAAGHALSDLEKEGMIQRFEYTFELAWKCLKDYLEASGVVLDPVTPRQVIKEAFAAGLLADGAVWIEMLDRRNLLAHTYNPAVLEQAAGAVTDRFLGAFAQLHERLTREEAK